MKIRPLASLGVFFIFFGMATTGILRFLDNTPLIATLHMTFAFTMFMIIFVHISNNWRQLLGYLKKDKKELSVALAFFFAVVLVGCCIHFFSIGSEVV